jgi:hypothetical protein
MYNCSPCPRVHSWDGCNGSDIQAIVALETGIGMCDKRSLEECFSESHWLNNEHNYTVMLQDFLLWASLHFSSGEGQISKQNPKYDPPFRIRPILTTAHNTWSAKGTKLCSKGRLHIETSSLYNSRPGFTLTSHFTEGSLQTQ